MHRLALGLVAVWLLGSTPITAAAAGDSIKTGLLALNRGLNAARKDSPACRDSALAALKDARDLLEGMRGRPSLDGFTAARRKVEDLADSLGESCNPETRKVIDEILANLRDSVTALADEASAPSPQEKKTQELRQCWNYRNDWSPVDPACHAPKNGNYPLAKADFDQLIAKLKNANDRFDQGQLIEKNVGYESKRWVSCAQVAEILRLLGSDVDRLEAVKVVAPRLVDPQNSGVALARIGDPSTRKDAMQTISEMAR